MGKEGSGGRSQRSEKEQASPTFKQRFMYMSGYEDEAAFDALLHEVREHGELTGNGE